MIDTWFQEQQLFYILYVSNMLGLVPLPSWLLRVLETDFTLWKFRNNSVKWNVIWFTSLKRWKLSNCNLPVRLLTLKVVHVFTLYSPVHNHGCIHTTQLLSPVRVVFILLSSSLHRVVFTLEPLLFTKLHSLHLFTVKVLFTLLSSSLHKLAFALLSVHLKTLHASLFVCLLHHQSCIHPTLLFTSQSVQVYSPHSLVHFAIKVVINISSCSLTQSIELQFHSTCLFTLQSKLNSPSSCSLHNQFSFIHCTYLCTSINSVTFTAFTLQSKLNSSHLLI